MKFVSAHGGVLHVDSAETAKCEHSAFTTGLAAWDALAPSGVFARGVIHELLSEGEPPLLLAALLGKAAAAGGYVVWSDPRSELYPPALAALGLSPERLLVLRTADPADELWGVAECLRCEGVAATIAAPKRLSRVEARRLQLAAERGGGVGLLLRQTNRFSVHYAAATRWRVEPTQGEVDRQRWRVELIHGHGGQVASPIFVEVCRETNHVSAIDAVAGRSTEAKTGRVSA